MTPRRAPAAGREAEVAVSSPPDIPGLAEAQQVSHDNTNRAAR